MKTYVAKKGDTLSAIARKHKVSVAKIAKANNIKNVNIISVGQVLNIPESTAETDLKTAFNNCLSAIEKLPEYKILSDLLNG